MSVENIRSEALKTIKTLLKNNQRVEAEIVARLFRANSKSAYDELVFYGRLQLLLGKYQFAKKLLSSSLRQKDDEDVRIEIETAHWRFNTRDDIREMRAGSTLSYILDRDDIHTVMDVGSGGGEHALQFANAGKKVHCVDFGKSVYVKKSTALRQLETMETVRHTIGNFMEFPETETYDLVWCSHVLEHQPNANQFLKKALALTAPEKYLAIIVPPLKHKIVGGHVSLWNAGLLLYQLIMAGNDCSDAVIMNYGYNVSVVVRRRPIELPDLDYDAGDIDRLAAFFPPDCGERFDGRMIGYSMDKVAPRPLPVEETPAGEAPAPEEAS